MRIGVIAPPFERVPPEGYGGSERVVYGVTEGLVARGHEVVLFATGDSRTSAELRSIFDKALHIFDEFSDEVQANFAFQHAAEFDVIHDHTYLGAGVRYSQVVKVPTVTTVHNIPYKNSNDPTERIYSHYNRAPLVSVSNAQRKLFSGANFIETVYNGVDLNEFAFHPDKDEYMLHIGAISVRKGSQVAVQVARKTGRPLKLAGKIDPWDEQFFAEEIEPYLEPGFIEFCGEVGGQQRIDLFQRAHSLLFPIAWPEPFGLVMTEAMACGTPVIAFNDGSVPEVIADGKTGFIVAGIDEMCAAVGRIDQIDRQACYEHVAQNFSNERMVERYEQVYERLIAG